ncbi:MAG TPA: hypothetical protein VMM60_16165 [Ilumatobacter sp.]|nr:hypothetical protein [Ilumatobacter sp.]
MTTLQIADRVPARTVLVFVHPAQHDHPRLRALHQQAETLNISIEHCDLSSTVNWRDSDIDAVAGIGPLTGQAIRFAIDNELLHLDLDDVQVGGQLDDALNRVPDAAPVIATTVNGVDAGYGLERVHLEGPQRFAVAVDRHRWADITGPIVVEISSRRCGQVWMSVHDGPAVILSASPALSSTISVAAGQDTVVIIDEQRRRLEQQSEIVLSLPLRHQRVRINS